MISFARKIDALGGAAMSSSASDRLFNEGHSYAITAAIEIAEDADAMIDELIEMIEDVLTGGRVLQAWVTDAETLLRRIRSRQS